MKVKFVLRSDFREKDGGDTRQIREILKPLSEMGVASELVAVGDDLHATPHDILHAVNIDRPLDLIHVARSDTSPLVVSTIHHGNAAVRSMRRAAAANGGRAMANRLPVSVRESLSYCIRLGSPLWSRPHDLATTVQVLFRAPRMWSSIGQVLDRAAAVVVLANGEAANLARDTGWNGLNGHVIPNAIPSALPPLEWQHRSSRLLVIGRIEWRKRQVEIAREAVKQGVGVDFVGAIVPRKADGSESYGSEFLEICRGSNLLNYLGPLDHEHVKKLMAGRRVVFSASWVEVLSLVDLEAAVHGCWVFTTSMGHSKEWIPQVIHEYSPSNLSESLDAAHGIAVSGEKPPMISFDWTWQRVAESLGDIYRDVSAG